APTPTPPEPSVRDRDREPAPVLTGTRVLVVEDEPDSRALFEQSLASYGARVDTAASADEAIARLRAEHYDVLISDLGMPQRDGLSLVRELRGGSSENAHIPAIAVSGHLREQDRSATAEAGFEAHLGKPVDPIELGTAVARALGREHSC
ncbi:MAG: response regulator, partial [Myxococcota bacterium]|nr:response regulator [Myxococcota bacterium]